MSGPLYIAVDLGAGSGRVFVAACDAEEFLLEEVHRFRYPPYFDGQVLRWNFGSIFDELTAGLRLAGEKAAALGRDLASIGVDSWGVDYGLVDANGRLLADPVCYRDARTNGAMERVFAEVPRGEIFERTGIQFQKFNTLYQLISDRKQTEEASMLLLLPDLINYMLTGNALAEYTNATTTQMVNVKTGDWDLELLERLALPHGLLQNISPAGTHVGTLKEEIGVKTGLGRIKVIAPGTHDTASAVAAAKLADGSAYISSGTWSLIGIERSRPLITHMAATHNFTNEGGVYDTFRFLKNVMGLWIFECCRKEWGSAGGAAAYDELIGAAEALEGFPALIYPDDERFLNPESMLDAIRSQFAETGQEADDVAPVVTKMIFDSLAFRYAAILRSIESVSGTTISRVEILGGGGRNRYLNQMTANASGLPVRAGLTEATVVGNVLVQAIASGRFATLSEARDYVASKTIFEEFEPRAVPDLDEAKERYSALEARFTIAAARAGEGG